MTEQYKWKGEGDCPQRPCSYCLRLLKYMEDLLFEETIPEYPKGEHTCEP